MHPHLDRLYGSHAEIRLFPAAFRSPSMRPRASPFDCLQPSRAPGRDCSSCLKAIAASADTRRVAEILTDVAVAALGLATVGVWVPFRGRWLNRHDKPKILPGVGHRQYAVALLFSTLCAVTLLSLAASDEPGFARLARLYVAGLLIGCASIVAWTLRAAAP